MVTLARKANQFRNLKELERYIINNIPEKIMQSRDVENILKKEMYQAVYDVVYAVYEPEYERRADNGGLSDMRTMEITDAIVKGKTFTMIFQNLAQGNDTLSGEYLTDTIEQGLEDNWETKGIWSKPRPFVYETAQAIKANPKPLINAVIKAFLKCGFKVK